MFSSGADWIPVSAIPLIHRSCSNRALLRGSHITGRARYIVIWYHWRTHWLQCAIGRVTPTQEKHTQGSNFRQWNTPLGKGSVELLIPLQCERMYRAPFWFIRGTATLGEPTPHASSESCLLLWGGTMGCSKDWEFFPCLSHPYQALPTPLAWEQVTAALENRQPAPPREEWRLEKDMESARRPPRHPRGPSRHLHRQAGQGGKPDSTEVEGVLGWCYTHSRPGCTQDILLAMEWISIICSKYTTERL